MMNDFPQRLSAALQLPLPGRMAQQTMEPELAYGRHFGPSLPDARAAAVVVMMYRSRGQWQMPLMRRPDSLSHHAGQISLPGGLIEPGESSEEAALRELEEELGIPRFGALLLGQLSPLYLFGSNFLITPWVASIRSQLVFKPSAAEVQELFKVPLIHLLDPASRGAHLEMHGSVAQLAPHFNWRGSFVWGATAMMLAELAAIASAIFAPHD